MCSYIFILKCDLDFLQGPQVNHNPSSIPDQRGAGLPGPRWPPPPWVSMGLSMGATPIAGWFISWKIPWKFMMTGGYPSSRKPPYVHLCTFTCYTQRATWFKFKTLADVPFSRGVVCVLWRSTFEHLFWVVSARIFRWSNHKLVKVGWAVFRFISFICPESQTTHFAVP